MFSNCENQNLRQNLTLKFSNDDGKSFLYFQVIESGNAGYSDIAVDFRGCIYVLYESEGGKALILAKTAYANFTRID